MSWLSFSLSRQKRNSVVCKSQSPVSFMRLERISWCVFWGSKGDSHRRSSSTSRSAIVSTHTNYICFGGQRPFIVSCKLLTPRKILCISGPDWAIVERRLETADIWFETFNNSVGTGRSIACNESMVCCIFWWFSSSLDNTAVDVLERRAL